jgi:flagellar motor switch protein FliN
VNSSAASLFDTLANQLQLELSQTEENVFVSWDGEKLEPQAEPLHWSWVLSIDSASRIMIAAPMDTWREFCNLHGDVSTEDLRTEIQPQLTRAIEETVKSRFGSEVICTEDAGPENPSADWTAVRYTVRWGSGREVSIQASINADFEAALGAEEEPEATSEEPVAPKGSNRVEILMDVELPVSVSLGRTRLRLKELMQASAGSVIELDQGLSDEVEIRVNNHLIAYGEVVAVEGNYAVRILRMAQPGDPGLSRILSERAA